MFGNSILDSLPKVEADTVRPLLEEKLLLRGEVLNENLNNSERLWLPTGVVLSLDLLTSRGHISTAIVGRTGALIPSALVSEDSPSRTRESVAIGGTALSCDFGTVRDLLPRLPSLEACLRQNNLNLLHLTQLNFANALTQTLDQRLSNWLLLAAELRQSDELNLSQVDLAAMVGARRTTVNLVLKEISELSLVTVRRGLIKVINAEGLRELARVGVQRLARRESSVEPVRDGNAAEHLTASL